jgi:hypothetical protein
MENPDDAQQCRSCGAPVDKGSGDIGPKTCGLAIAAFVLAVVSVVVLPVGLIAIALGIAGIIIIERSGGRLTGRVFALLGILIPVFVFCLIFVLMMVLFPALTRVKSQARTIACQSNLKQWGLTVMAASLAEMQSPRDAGGWTRCGCTTVTINSFCSAPRPQNLTRKATTVPLPPGASAMIQAAMGSMHGSAIRGGKRQRRSVNCRLTITGRL